MVWIRLKLELIGIDFYRGFHRLLHGQSIHFGFLSARNFQFKILTFAVIVDHCGRFPLS